MQFSLTKEYKFLFLILFGVIAFYIRSMSYGFIWDDINYIINNPLFEDSTGLIKIWTSKAAPDFWPITYSVFWIMKYILGGSNEIFHVLNLSLFVISIFLIYKILDKFNYKYKLLVTAIYAFHPVNVELVAWVFQIKSNLAIVFGLLSTLCWVSFLNTRKTKHYIACFAFLILSFLCKISLVFLPILFILINYNHAKNIDFKSLAKKIVPVLVVTFIIGLVNVFWGDIDVYQTPESEIALNPNLFFRLALVGKTFWFYFFHVLFPKDFMFVYPRFSFSTDAVISFVPVVSFVFCSLLSLYGFITNRFRKISSLFLVIVLLLFPVLGMFEIYYMRFSYVADHWVGLALVPIIIFLVEGVRLMFVNVLKINAQYLNFIYYFCVVLGLSYLIFLSNIHIVNFKDEQTLYENSLTKNDESALLHSLLGQIYKNKNQLDQAIVHFDRANEISPSANYYHNLATIYELKNNPDLVVGNYLRSIELNPYVPLSYLNLGTYYARRFMDKEAVGIYNLAIERNLNSPEIYYNLAIVFMTKDKSKSLQYIDQALRLAPDNKIILQKKNQILALP